MLFQNTFLRPNNVQRSFVKHFSLSFKLAWIKTKLSLQAIIAHFKIHSRGGGKMCVKFIGILVHAGVRVRFVLQQHFSYFQFSVRVCALLKFSSISLIYFWAMMYRGFWNEGPLGKEPRAIKDSPSKAYSKSEYSLACFAHCQEFCLPCSFHFIVSWFSSDVAWHVS